MTHRRPLLRLAVLVVVWVSAAISVGACRRSGTPTPEPAAAPSPTAAIVYEPAYPADVSTEGLGAQDVSQQEGPHSHDGGSEHSHGEGEKHEEDDDHGHPH